MRYTEQQISSALLDQPVFPDQPKKLLICSTARSGSYMLCRYMINAGLGVPHEYFNPIVMRQIAPRLGLDAELERLQWQPPRSGRWLPFRRPDAAQTDFLRRYIEALVPRRCQRGIFAAKVHFGHYRKVLDNPVGQALTDNAAFIHLFRENLLDQAISTLVASLTGRWGIDETVTTAPAERQDFFDVAALDRLLTELADEDRGWRVFLARQGGRHLSISYEQFCADPWRWIDRIAVWLDIDPQSLRRGYTEAGESPARDAGLPGKAEITRHYLAAIRRPTDEAAPPPLPVPASAPAGHG